MILVVHNAENTDHHYNAPLTRHLSRLADIRVVNYRQLDGISLADFDGAVISGVPKHYPYSTIFDRHAYLEVLFTATLPVLGICLGHQNMGTWHGAELIEDLEAEEGLMPLQVLQDDPIVTGIESGHEIFASHRGSVSLPVGFVRLASTQNCRNQIMKHADKAMYGVQFHPEFSVAGAQVLANFVRITQQSAAAASLQPLALETELAGRVTGQQPIALS